MRLKDYRKAALRVSMAAALVFSAGCAHRTTVRTAPPPVVAPAAPDRADTDVDVIARSIDYWQEIEGLPAETLGTEYQRRQQDYLADRDDPEKRLKVVLLLSLADTPVRNVDMALSLVNEYIDSAADDDLLLNWFLFLNDNLQQQRYAERQLKTLQKRQEQSQQQLEDLKTIEKTLQERNTPTPGAR